MFTRYLRRELSGRRKQTAIIAIAMALAIGLVVIVNSLSAGVRDAQGAALASVYGVGTDITVTATPTPPAAGEGRGGPRFEFDADAGTATSDGTTAVSQSVLMSGRGTATFDASAVDTVSGQDGVKAASGVLALTNSTFDGELPQRGTTGTTGSTSGGANATPPQGAGPGGGGQFDVNSFSVMGVDSKSDAIGPLASATLQEGRLLSADDAGKNNLVVDAAYATTEELKLKDKVEIAGTKFTIVGIVAGSGADAETASNTYIPLDVAQKLSDNCQEGQHRLRAGRIRLADPHGQDGAAGCLAGQHRQHPGGPGRHRVGFAVHRVRTRFVAGHLAFHRRVGRGVPAGHPAHAFRGGTRTREGR